MAPTNNDGQCIESIANGPRVGSGNSRRSAWQQTEAKRVSGGGRDGRRKGGPFKPARVVLYVFDFFFVWWG